MSFANFPAQKQAVALLQRSLERERLGHAYLFSGPELGELEAMARTLSKTLNCQEPARGKESGAAVDSCDVCLSCRKIEEGNHPDAQWVRPESKSRVITIDQMRELMQTVHLKPGEAAYKVAVIVAADRLNAQAANAFLKTLEEPPARSILILLSTEPGRVLETILSRCLQLRFAGENAGRFDAEKTGWIGNFSAMAAEGEKGVLGRYRLLGHLLEQLAKIRAATEERLTALSPLEKNEEAEKRYKDKWEEELKAAIEAEYRRERSELLLVLQFWLRDVWLETMETGGELLHFPELRPAGQAVARRIGAEEARENLGVMERMQRLLATNVQEALALEVGLLKLKI